MKVKFDGDSSKQGNEDQIRSSEDCTKYLQHL